MLFVYCLGINAGPVFLRMVFREGKPLAVMASLMIVSAGLATWLVATTFNLPSGLASGLFAGALTSTPALAAITERLPPDSEAAVGFGVAYPIGVIGVILFVQFAPRLFPKIQASVDERNRKTLPTRALLNGPWCRSSILPSLANGSGTWQSSLTLIVKSPVCWSGKRSNRFRQNTS